MFPMQNFEPESAMISVSSNFALIEKYLRNTCLGQGVVPKEIHSNIIYFYIVVIKAKQSSLRGIFSPYEK